jgi:hypothetical protein
VSEPAGASDELALRRLSDAYASAVDRRDLAALCDCFAPDGRLVLLSGSREPREYPGHDGLADVMTELGRFELTLHHVSTCSIVFDGAQPHGVVAGVAHHVSARDEGASDLVLQMRYEDTYGRGADMRWRFSERLAHVLFSERRAVRLP